MILSRVPLEDRTEAIDASSRSSKDITLPVAAKTALAALFCPSFNACFLNAFMTAYMSFLTHPFLALPLPEVEKVVSLS